MRYTADEPTIMRTNRKLKTFLIVLAVFGVIDAAVFFALRSPAVADSISRRTSRYYYDQIRTHWGERIAEEGGAAAYAELKTKFAGGDPTAAHDVAHAFGEVLYAKEGLEGLKVCDDDITYGCFHGFIETAVAKEGLDALDSINRECKKQFGDDETGCRHGVGHGVMELTGPKALDTALAYCSQIQEPGLLGCTHGAFMEYMTAEAGTMDPAKPEEPCTSVQERFRPSCYFQLPNWWNGVFHEDYGAMGARCAALGDGRSKYSCLMSVGKTALEFHSYDIPTAIKACDLMPTEEARTACRAGAYWLHSNVVKDDTSAKLCAFSAPERSAACLELAASVSDASRW